MTQNNQTNSPFPTAINKGGTGVTSVTTAPTASTWSGWDANKNASANSFIPGYTTTVTSSTPVVLVVGSTWQQYLTGSTAQTVTLPVTSTLVLGQSFFIVNNSSNNTTVNSSGANAVQVMTANTTALVTCILTSGTTAASWSVDYTTESSGANFPVNTNITSMTGLTGTLKAPTGIASSTGLNLLVFTYTGSAVNYLQFINNSTGLFPRIAAAGSDTNITLALVGQGTGGVYIGGTGTNDNALAGQVGEFVSSIIASASPVSLANGTAKDLTSISLTAGDWDVWGNITFLPGGATNVTYVVDWISLTSATIPDASLFNINAYPAAGFVPAGVSIGKSAPPLRVSIASTTTVYISGQSGFTISTLGMCGGIYARRVR